MVREMTELQGTMGGIYAREDGQPEEVWKAIYYHYLPVGVEADAPPTKEQLGARGASPGRPSRWPTSSTRSSACLAPASGRRARAIRTGCAVRRRAWSRMLVDLPELTGSDDRVRSASSSQRATRASELAGRPTGKRRCTSFLLDRVRYVLEQRGFDVRNVRAVTSGHAAELQPAAGAAQARRAARVHRVRRTSSSSRMLFKRVRNIAHGISTPRRRTIGARDRDRA